MTHRIRKVLVVNTADRGGGTERFAWLLFKGLEQRGIEAWLVVGQKLSDDPRVTWFWSSRFIRYRPYRTFWYSRVLPGLRKFDHTLGLECFHYPLSARLLDITGSPPDVVLACNLHGDYFDLRELAKLSRKIPVVVRPGDGWLGTGHCAIPASCERWRTGCGRCPDLARPPAVRHDLTRLNWWRKRRIYRSAHWSVVAPSAWQMQRLDQSILRYAVGPRRVIGNGVDQTIFSRGSRAESRNVLKLRQDTVIGLLVANLGPNSPSKDFSTLRAALLRLSSKAKLPPLEILIVGGKAPSEMLGAVPVHWHPYCALPEKLAHYYRAADFLINPALEETFSNANAEAMCCGLPILANRVAAIPESVIDGKTGLLVPPANIEALTAALDRLAHDDSLRQRLSHAAAGHAKQAFSLDLMIDRYLELFDDLIDKQPTKTKSVARAFGTTMGRA